MYFPELGDSFARLLDDVRGQRIAVLGHKRPDGDCIGSQVALCRLLQRRGVEAICVNADPVPRRLQFLLGDTKVVLGREFAPDGQTPEGWQAVLVDCADHGRIGDRLWKVFSEPIGSIDHHLSNDHYARRNLVDSAAAATAEILAGLFYDAGLDPDPVSAQALYAGIATDTGQFRFPSTTRRVFEITGRLINNGADPAAASAELYERESLGKIELLGRFLASFRLFCEGRVCVGFLRQSDFSETGAQTEDTEGLVDYARGIEGVDIGVLLEERPRGMKASLRAKDPAYRVDQLAQQFGGGGHACAAGLNVECDTETLLARITAAIETQLARVDAARRS